MQPFLSTKHVSPDDVAAPEDLFDVASLEAHLTATGDDSFALVAVGDVMLGGRAKPFVQEHGADYAFRSVRPLLRRAAIGLGNLEGPMARTAQREARNFSYRVDPDLASALHRAGIGVVTLANNHLVDCGREGVLETMNALQTAGVRYVGAGKDEIEAHLPVVLEANGLRIGMLGYYWNRRCAAIGSLPGSAMDPPAALERDIAALRRCADRVVVTFHWGIPYEREPSPEDRKKAHQAIEFGADVVVGHHPHIVQAFEIHRERPIFYSVGNFTFGSGNSRGEGLLLGFRFEERRTQVLVYPLYVKNRDPRVAYQPKVLRGPSAAHVLDRLKRLSRGDGKRLVSSHDRGVLDLPYVCAGISPP